MTLCLKKRAFLFLNRLLIWIAPFNSDIHNLGLWKISNGKEYKEYQESTLQFLTQARTYENSLIKNAAHSSADWFPVKGVCFLCRKKVSFYVDFNFGAWAEGRRLPNWREHLLCPCCRLNNRSRAAVHLFELLLHPEVGAKIYVTEQTTPLFRLLKRRYPNAVGSEYLSNGTRPGQRNRRGIRHEDLTRLTFGEGVFDFILSFDVFEHIFDLEAALRECHRCLKDGGTLFFTVPFHFHKNENVSRAIIDKNGEIIHLYPPEFHGDPLNRKGILCYHDLGWAFLNKLRRLGFKGVHALIYWSRGYGYLGRDQCVFLARK